MPKTTQTFLIVGKTGNGKSTVCNVISNSSKFEESDAMASMTKFWQIEEFDVDTDTTFRLADTIGIGSR